EEIGADEPVDHKEDDPEEEGGDNEDEDTTDHLVRARDGPRGVAVTWGDPVVPNEPHHDEPEDEATQQREDAAQPEGAGALPETLAVVPDAGEPGEAVVEGDHGPESGHGVPDHAAPV